MQRSLAEEHDLEQFPRAGVRARRWRRFEDGLEEWLGTPEGRFMTWCAQRQVDESALAARP
ncbi:hypothetical protein [Capillimicrobium parvum]|nr:hypothetical protein [Capillimicrobium parvum]